MRIIKALWGVVRIPLVFITRLRIALVNETLIMIYRISKSVFPKRFIDKVVENILKFASLCMSFYVSDFFLSLCFLLFLLPFFWVQLDPAGFVAFCRPESLLRFRHIILFSFIWRLMGRNLILSFDPEYSDYNYLDVYRNYNCEVYFYLFITSLIGRSRSEAQYWEEKLREFEPTITLCEVYERVNIFFNLTYHNPLSNEKKRW